MNTVASLLLTLIVAAPASAIAAEVPNRSPASYRNQEIKDLKRVVEPTTQAPAPQEVAEDTQATGDWNGQRKILSDKGLDLAMIYKGEYNSNFSGGLRRRSVYLENLDLRLALDANKAWGWKGTSFFIYGLGNAGGDRDAQPSKNVGDVQVTSNIETPSDSFKLYELWLQQNFLDDKISVLVGLHDFASEFYVTETSAFFSNSTFGVGRELSQTGINGPSIFPTTALAARVAVQMTDELSAQVAVFGAQAGDPTHTHGTSVHLRSEDGSLTVAELSRKHGSDEGHDKGKITLGVWSYSKDFDHLTDTYVDGAGDSVATKAKSQGFYLVADQRLYESVAVFVRYGRATTTTNRIGTGASAGLVWTAPFSSRPKDRVGFGIATAVNGNEYKSSVQQAGGASGDIETSYELNYRFEVSPGVALQPNLQYVQNPNMDPALKDATVGALRIELNF